MSSSMYSVFTVAVEKDDVINANVINANHRIVRVTHAHIGMYRYMYIYVHLYGHVLSCVPVNMYMYMYTVLSKC